MVTWCAVDTAFSFWVNCLVSSMNCFLHECIHCNIFAECFKESSGINLCWEVGMSDVAFSTVDIFSVLQGFTFNSAIVPSLLERFVHIVSWWLVSLAWFNCGSFPGGSGFLSFLDWGSSCLLNWLNKRSIVKLVNFGQVVFSNEVNQVLLGQVPAGSTRLNLCQLNIVVLNVKPCWWRNLPLKVSSEHALC